jgi:hypothetical protein
MLQHNAVVVAGAADIDVCAAALVAAFANISSLSLLVKLLMC